MTQNMDNDTDWERFRELLDSQNEWPAEFPFKFIVPRAGLVHLEKIFQDHELTVRESRRGNYVSISVKTIAASADAIVEIYEAAANIDGIISL